MDSKSYAYLDRYAQLHPYSNFLLYHTNYSLSPMELRRKRILGFYLKKLKRFIYSAETDPQNVELCLSILTYLILSFNPEQHKVEVQLIQHLEDLTCLLHRVVGDQEILTHFYNHVSQLSKKKQKYTNAFHYLQRIVGLMTMTHTSHLIPDFLVAQYTQNADHMNNIRFTLLLNTFHTQTNHLELTQYKEKVLKCKEQTTDMILDLALQTQKEESMEDVLNILRPYKSDFNGADSFLIKKRYFQLAYENGDQLEKDEIIELLKADLFDLTHVHQIITYVEFFVDDPDLLIKEIILLVLDFSYGSTQLWGKLVRLLSEREQKENEEGEQISEEFQDEENHDSEYSHVKKLAKTLSLDENEINLLAKVHFSGRYMNQDIQTLKTMKESKINSALTFLEHKQSILKIFLAQQKDNPILLAYKKAFKKQLRISLPKTTLLK